jgi:diguanylate cyclase (GGDEF)-like protein
LLSSGFAVGVLAGAVVLCGATALSHVLLAQLVQTKTGSLWSVAWLLLALGAGGEVFNLILPVVGTRGVGGARVLAGLLAMGAALDSRNAGPAADRSGLWWILGVAGVLMVLAALLPLATGRMILGAALLLVVAWLMWKVWASVERMLPRLLFIAGLTVLGGWAAATLFAPVGTVIGTRVAAMAGALLLGLGLLAVATVLVVVTAEIGALDEEITELGETHQHLLRLAESDPLTGCPSRQALRAWFERWEGGEPVSVVLIDIDNLKRINDRHGHRAGDEALRLVAGVLKESIRPGDLVVRWGGDEFVAVLRGAAHDAATRRFTTLIGTLEEAAEGFPYEASLRVDWGVSSCVAASDISRSLAEADERMYAMKRRRRREAGGDV